MKEPTTPTQSGQLQAASTSTSSKLMPLLHLQFATITLAFAGVLANVINMHTLALVGARAILAAPVLYIYLILRKEKLIPSTRKARWIFLASGILMTAHWITYFMAVRTAGVAVGMLAMFTFPIMTALVEPYVFKHKMKWHTIVGAGLIITGFVVVAGRLNVDEKHLLLGALWGLLSAVIFTMRNLISKSLTQEQSGVAINAGQMVIVAVICTPFLFLPEVWYQAKVDDYIYILAMAWGVTAVGHSMFVNAFKHFSTATASVINSLQPIYGAFIAWVWLSQEPDLRTLIGGCIILSAVVMESILSQRKQK